MLETPASQSHAQVEAHYAKYASQHNVPTILCPICDAVYAPALVQASFLQASPDRLESAFMSMCHFCFRCRRPACPQCWDSVHGVCGDCVREANLSFRAEAAPLNGMLFRPLRWQEQGQQEVAAALLTCVKPGRFLHDGGQEDTAPAEEDSMTSGHIPARLQDVHALMPVEDMQYKTTLILPAAVSQRVTEKVAIAPMEQADEEHEHEEHEDVEPRSHPIVLVFRVIERALTVLALALLLAIIALIIAAQTSEAANTAIVRVLHIDIRAEVAYLVHLVQQLRQ